MNQGEKALKEKYKDGTYKVNKETKRERQHEVKTIFTSSP